MNKSCILDIPYPALDISAPSRDDALLLLPSYAGSAGELTAVCDYNFQSVVTASDSPAVSDTLECIAMTEMRHLRILAEMIHRLGLLPKLYAPKAPSRKTRWWSGAFVDNIPTAEVFLRENIRREQLAAKNYRALVGKIKDQSVKAMLERIILDEEHHAKIFTELL